MDWQEEYKRKLVSADEAARVVKNGDRIYMSLSVQPRVIPKAVVARRDELNNVEVFIASPRYDPGWLVPGGKNPFKLASESHLGVKGRGWLDPKESDYLPNAFSLKFKTLERPQEWRDIDVFITVVSPPDEHGYCSFGATLWDKKAAAKVAKKTLAEVDKYQIRTGGNNYIHVSEIDYFVDHTPAVPTDEELTKLISHHKPETQETLWKIWNCLDEGMRSEHVLYIAEAGPAYLDLMCRALGFVDFDKETKSIFEHIKPLIKDRDVLEIGGVGLSSTLALGGVFDDRQDLGIHSEVLSRGIGRLIEGGVFNGKYKNLHPGKIVATSLTGLEGKELQFMNKNPICELYDCPYVVNIQTVAAHDNFVALNSILSIDLTGQINIESVFGARIWGGQGGQPEFHMGAVLSKGGRAISLLNSTAHGGTISRIVAQHETGSVITIPRFFADHVVTEYGVARLMGKTLRERAEELINIAHPNFRPELRAAARKLFYPLA